MSKRRARKKSKVATPRPEPARAIPIGEQLEELARSHQDGVAPSEEYARKLLVLSLLTRHEESKPKSDVAAPLRRGVTFILLTGSVAFAMLALHAPEQQAIVQATSRTASIAVREPAIMDLPVACSVHVTGSTRVPLIWNDASGAMQHIDLTPSDISIHGIARSKLSLAQLTVPAGQTVEARVSRDSGTPVLAFTLPRGAAFQPSAVDRAEVYVDGERAAGSGATGVIATIARANASDVSVSIDLCPDWHRRHVLFRRATVSALDTKVQDTFAHAETSSIESGSILFPDSTDSTFRLLSADGVVINPLGATMDEIVLSPDALLSWTASFPKASRVVVRRGSRDIDAQPSMWNWLRAYVPVDAVAAAVLGLMGVATAVVGFIRKGVS